MTTNELKHLKRSELLQMLLLLVEENEHLKEELEKATQQLNSRTIACDNAGSVADVTLQFNKVFDDAERAVQQYLMNVKDMYLRQAQHCQQIEMDALKKADVMIHEANAYKKACIKQADMYWDEVHSKVQKLMEEQHQFHVLSLSGGGTEQQ